MSQRLTEAARRALLATSDGQIVRANGKGENILKGAPDISPKILRQLSNYGLIADGPDVARGAVTTVTQVLTKAGVAVLDASGSGDVAVIRPARRNRTVACVAFAISCSPRPCKP
jgi:hypothetical protein